MTSNTLTTDGTILDVYRVDRSSKVARPLFLAGVAAGFPSPADDHIDRSLNLNELMIQHPAATFFVRVAGDSMTGAGIHDNDILVVDRSLPADPGRVVIAVVDSELTVKRLCKKNNRTILAPENNAYPEIELVDGMECAIWGVATWVVHKL